MGNRAIRVLNTQFVGITNGNQIPSTRRFGVFELDLRAGELRRNGSKIKLQEQPFQVLAELLDRPGQVVTREELRNRLWPADTYVDFDHILNAAVRRLRDALGDAAENPTFVETVARRGYRFLAPVTAQGVNGNGTALPRAGAVTGESPRSLLRAWPYVAAVATIALVIIAFKFGERLGHIFPS